MREAAVGTQAKIIGESLINSYVLPFEIGAVMLTIKYMESTLPRARINRQNSSARSPSPVRTTRTCPSTPPA